MRQEVERGTETVCGRNEEDREEEVVLSLGRDRATDGSFRPRRGAGRREGSGGDGGGEGGLISSSSPLNVVCSQNKRPLSL